MPPGSKLYLVFIMSIISLYIDIEIKSCSLGAPDPSGPYGLVSTWSYLSTAKKKNALS